MSLPQATLFPYNGQSFSMSVSFFSNVDGSLIKNWTGAAGTIIIDNGAPVSLMAGELPVENAGTGMGIVTLSAAHVTGNLIQCNFTVTNTNANQCRIDLYTWASADPTGAWYNQAVLRPENQINDIADYILNLNTMGPGSTATQTVYKKDGTTIKFTATVTQTMASGAQRSALS